MVQENIKNKPKGFGTVAPAFLEGGGAEFALEKSMDKR